jgi:hypothetical protein
VFASDMAFTVHRGGCRGGNDHWKTNLVLLPNGIWGTYADQETHSKMMKALEAKAAKKEEGNA